jgi:hypothetical protein
MLFLPIVILGQSEFIAHRTVLPIVRLLLTDNRREIVRIWILSFSLWALTVVKGSLTSVLG